jgi:hypothetical protein
MPLLVSPIAYGGKDETTRTSTVTFAEDTWLNKELEVPSTPSTCDSEVPPIPAKPQAIPMKRSQSYSAISELNLSSREGSSSRDVNSASRRPNPCTKEYEQFRDYFHKFVDLVIVRETKAAILQTQLSDISV